MYTLALLQVVCVKQKSILGYINHFNTYKNVGTIQIVNILLKQLFIKLDYLVSHIHIVISNVKHIWIV